LNVSGKDATKAPSTWAATQPGDTLTTSALKDGLFWELLDGSQTGQTLRTDTLPVRIGSASDNTLVINNPTVSRHHAEVVAADGRLVLTDLGSTNGTYLSGHRIERSFLTRDNQLRFGKFAVRLRLAAEQQTEENFGELRGSSPVMLELYQLLRRISASDVSVLLWGETGTGKELAARAIHEHSARSEGPLSVLDCSAVDRDLISSELFGHEPGAYTGATTTRQGAFEQAHKGTLFIDEVGELPLELQAKLLRALETREIRRLGGSKNIRVDCRVISATHRDLDHMVQTGAFRRDLYYRLAQITARIPPLRERTADIALLVDHFLSQLARAGRKALPLDAAALERLCQARLEGNVRELRNIVERACVLSTHASVRAGDLVLPAAPTPANEPMPQLEQLEKDAVIKALEANGYHRGRTAAALGISAPTLRERIRRYGIRLMPDGRSQGDS
jgi:DNA-binding NtrC family response regulator